MFTLVVCTRVCVFAGACVYVCGVWVWCVGAEGGRQTDREKRVRRREREEREKQGSGDETRETGR